MPETAVNLKYELLGDGETSPELLEKAKLKIIEIIRSQPPTARFKYDGIITRDNLLKRVKESGTSEYVFHQAYVQLHKDGIINSRVKSQIWYIYQESPGKVTEMLESLDTNF